MTNYKAKVIMAGSYRVGKTSLIVRYCDNTFLEEYIQTIGANFYIKEIDQKVFTNSNINLTLFLWDICGQIDKLFVTEYYFQGAAAAIIVFDLTNEQSFKDLDFWIKKIRDLSGDIPFIIVGNKIDLENERKISKDIGIKKSADYNVNYIEASAKKDINVNIIFNDISKMIIARV